MSENWLIRLGMFLAFKHYAAVAAKIEISRKYFTSFHCSLRGTMADETNETPISGMSMMCEIGDGDECNQYNPKPAQ